MEIILNDWMVLVILAAIIVLMVLVAILIFYVYKAAQKTAKELTEEGVMLFGERMKTEDFLSFINSCVSYLLSYHYLHMEDFLSREVLRYATKRDFDIIETCINSYPIVRCKYVGQFHYVIEQEETILEYERYQSVSGEDSYIVPLFENDVVNTYGKIFNFQTRYQNLKNVTNILEKGSSFDEFIGKERSIKKAERDAQLTELDIPMHHDSLYLKVIKKR